MAHARKILIVDNDDDLRATLAEQISCHDFVAYGAATATEGEAALRRDRPDLVIMAVSLPDRDSLGLVKALRAEGYANPIIMLSGGGTEDEVVMALEAGANDCVSKPFRFAGLLARIRAHLRQHEGSEDASLQVGTFTFKPSAKLLVTPQGSRLRLTEKEAAILRFLYRAAPQARSRLDVLATIRPMMMLARGRAGVTEDLTARALSGRLSIVQAREALFDAMATASEADPIDHRRRTGNGASDGATYAKASMQKMVAQKYGSQPKDARR